MRYREGAELDPSQIGSSGGGGRRGAGIAVGGGAGGLILLVIVALFFPNLLGSMTGTDTGAQPGGGDSTLQNCRNVSDVEKDRNCRFVAYTNSIQAYWGTALQGYRVTQMIPFSQSVSTGCGQAGSEVGPFYCPEDQKVYIDLDFLDQLFQQLGTTSSDAAEAYVLAHEFGHHVQNLLGTMAEAQRGGNQTGADSPQVRLELQADCYAGVWFKHATEGEKRIFDAIDPDDIKKAQAAAIAVGDDHIQKQSGRGVNPDAWTHGSSAQRQKWLTTGLQSGDPRSCDTFSGGI